MRNANSCVAHILKFIWMGIICDNMLFRNNALWIAMGSIADTIRLTNVYPGSLAAYLYQNSSPPSAAYMRQWIVSALVQIMACRLLGAKPLSKQMLAYRQLDPKEHTSVRPAIHHIGTEMCAFLFQSGVL